MCVRIRAYVPTLQHELGLVGVPDGSSSDSIENTGFNVVNAAATGADTQVLARAHALARCVGWACNYCPAGLQKGVSVCHQ